MDISEIRASDKQQVETKINNIAKSFQRKREQIKKTISNIAMTGGTAGKKSYFKRKNLG
jgi:hypothetical protein